MNQLLTFFYYFFEEESPGEIHKIKSCEISVYFEHLITIFREMNVLYWTCGLGGHCGDD